MMIENNDKNKPKLSRHVKQQLWDIDALVMNNGLHIWRPGKHNRLLRCGYVQASVDDDAENFHVTTDGSLLRLVFHRINIDT